MSAKDLRRSTTIHVSASVRRHLSAERRCGRTDSAAAALRRIVDRELHHGYRDGGHCPAQTGVGYRLQLGRRTFRAVMDLGQRHGVPKTYILTQLLAAAVDRTPESVPRHDPRM